MRASYVFLTVVLVLETAAHAESVALVPLLGSGLGTDEVANDEKIIRAEIDAHYGAKSIPADQIQARMAEAVSIGLRCDRATVSCLVQLGVVCRADYVLLATVAPAAGHATLAFRLVSVADADQTAYASTTLAGAPRPEEVSALLGALEQPAARALRVDVRGAAGVRVVVDGKEVATLPLVAPLSDIPAGKHDVRLIGDDTYATTIDVRPGEPVLVEAPKAAPVPVAHVEEPLHAGPVALAAGAGVGVIGLAALVIGSVPRIGYELAANDLDQLDAAIGADPAKLAAHAADVKKARSDLESSDAAWNQWGATTAIAGGIAVAVGAAVATGALFLE